MRAHQLPNPLNPTMRILTVDDAVEMHHLLHLRLRQAGFAVMAATSGEEALELVRRQGMPHLALLDIVMPGMDGFTLAAELQRMSNVAIIFLSARSGAETKVKGLEHFAEDYITKPFTFAELVARIRRVLLRSWPAGAPPVETVIDHKLSVNFDHQYAVLDGSRVNLTPTESKLIQLLYHQRGRVLSPGALLAGVWNPLTQGTLQSLWVHIRRLRTKIEPVPRRPSYIVTERGRGYYLPVSEEKAIGQGYD